MAGYFGSPRRGCALTRRGLRDWAVVALGLRIAGRRSGLSARHDVEGGGGCLEFVEEGSEFTGTGGDGGAGVDSAVNPASERESQGSRGTSGDPCLEQLSRDGGFDLSRGQVGVDWVALVGVRPVTERLSRCRHASEQVRRDERVAVNGVPRAVQMFSGESDRSIRSNPMRRSPRSDCGSRHPQAMTSPR